KSMVFEYLARHADLDPATAPLITALTRKGHHIGFADELNFEYGLNCILDHACRLIDERRAVSG
ncbi:MAG: hypothetical protein JO152_07415, partial [Mycobacteriaceae bacterium]|nr:hypothetical protein [Mycobacteriaceae bacterium]